MMAYSSSSRIQPTTSHTSSSNPITHTALVSPTSREASRSLNNSFPGTTAPVNTINPTTSSQATQPLSQHKSHPCPTSRPHRLDSNPARTSLKAFNSDSNLVTVCLKEAARSPPAQQVRRRKAQSPRFPLHQQQPRESSPPRAELNKRKAETLWGKQLELDANQTLCRNSLPRPPPQPEARSKLRRSIDAELEAVEIEIQDILAQPLIAEITISSPSLFDETPSSSQSSSPPVTVQTLH